MSKKTRYERKRIRKNKRNKKKNVEEVIRCNDKNERRELQLFKYLPFLDKNLF
jgi:hypothetical protein